MRSIPLRDIAPSRLEWDGAVYDGDDFRWVLRHSKQSRADWCWAACLRNALSCFAVEVHDEDIVRQRYPQAGAAGDQRIPPNEIFQLWRSRGFTRARLCEAPLDEPALQRDLEEYGPVELELWRDDDPAARHLVLVTGYAARADGSTYRVSDPLADTETSNHSYDDLLRSLRGGRWRRTYHHLEYQGGALRRFVFRPARYLERYDLAPQDPDQGAPSCPLFSTSGLRVPELLAPKVFRNEMHAAVCGYRHFASRRQGRRRELRKTLWLGEYVPMVRHPGRFDRQSPLSGQWTADGWSSVIYTGGRASYYVWSDQLEDGEWYSRWVGEKWARNLAAGLRAAAARADSDDHVQIARARFWQIYLIRLVESERYLVAHVRGCERPFAELLSGDELAERLRRAAPREFARGLTPIGDAEWAV